MPLYIEKAPPGYRVGLFAFWAFRSVLAEPGEEILRLLALGIAEHVCRGALLADDALVHVHHPAALLWWVLTPPQSLKVNIL